MRSRVIFCGSLSKVVALISEREDRKNEEIESEKKKDNFKYIKAKINGRSWYFIKTGLATSVMDVVTFIRYLVGNEVSEDTVKFYHMSDIDETAEIVEYICRGLGVVSSELLSL